MLRIIETIKRPIDIPITVYVMFITFIPRNSPLPSSPKRLISFRNIIAMNAGTNGNTEYFTFINSLHPVLNQISSTSYLS